MDTYLANVQAKTGKTPDDFRKLAAERGLTTHGQVMTWLKSEFDLGHGHATAVAHTILQGDKPKASRDEEIARHFTGAKAAWRAPYDSLVAQLKAFGDDVDASPGNTYISLLRGDKKFGIVQVTGKRFDIGIKRKGMPGEGRFAESGSWNAMVTHRVQIDDPTQIDADVIAWLKQAYDKT